MSRDRALVGALAAMGLKPGDMRGDPLGNRAQRRLAKNAPCSREAIPDVADVVLQVFVGTLQGWKHSDTGDRFVVKLAKGEKGRTLVTLPDGRIAVYGSRDGVEVGDALWWTQSPGRYAQVRIVRHEVWSR